MRVALLTNILSPYRMPVFRDLAMTEGWDLRVLVNAHREFDRSWEVDGSGLDVQQVRSWSFKRRTRTRGRVSYSQVGTVHVPVGIPAALNSFRPDVVVTAELGMRTALALAWCRWNRVPCVVWSYHSRVSSTSTSSLKDRIRRALLRRASTVVGMGTQARDYLRTLGVSNDRIFDAPNAHDHDGCLEVISRLDAGQTRRWMASKGCRSRVAIVAGRLIPMKGVGAMLRAWQRLSAEAKEGWTLAFVGDGPQRDELEAAIAAAPYGEIVHLGEVQPDQAMASYAYADLMVFPSLGDPWGLVANESMACGTPVLCSVHAGCADDLVEPGVNGWIFDPQNDDNFDAALRMALAGAGDEAMERSARRTAERFRPATMAEGLRRGVLAAAARHGIAPPESDPAAIPAPRSVRRRAPDRVETPVP